MINNEALEKRITELEKKIETIDGIKERTKDDPPIKSKIDNRILIKNKDEK